MGTDENKALARRFIEEVYQKGHVELVDELTDENIAEHEEFGGEATSGREGIKFVITSFRKAFPDLRVTIEDEFAEGDRVFLRTTWHGTHRGDFMGVAATGRHVDFSSMDEIRFVDGRVSEHWGVSDSLGLLMQLGAIELPGQV